MVGRSEVDTGELAVQTASGIADRRSASAFGVTVTLAGGFLLLQILLAPGARHEEIFLITLIGLPYAAFALVSALLDPRPVAAPLTFSGLWLAGWIGTGLWIVVVNGYPIANVLSSEVLVPGVRIALVGFVAVFVVNLLSAALRRRLSGRAAAARER